MGQGQSQQGPGRTLDGGKVVLENRAPTPENERVDPKERERQQAEVFFSRFPVSYLASLNLFHFPYKHVRTVN